MLAAIKTAWNAERIDTITKRLLDYRNQLSTRVLLVLNQRHESRQEELSTLRNEIVEVIALTYKDLKASIGKQNSETAAAILTTRDGGSSALANPGVDAKFSERLASGRATQTSVTYSSRLGLSKGGESDQSQDVPEENQYGLMTVYDVGDYRTKILDSLHFRGITERSSTIPEAYANTFEWVWRDQAENLDMGKWESLSQWLQASKTTTSDCYWLSGKAGSGKSSLMKYLQNDQRTIDHLMDWAGTVELVMPSFYFWYAGTSLQKSQTGLLRSLLFDILSRRPDNIIVIFPELCRVIMSKKAIGTIEPTFTELRAAFARLVQNLPIDLRICFFIDGIDEYTGDHNDICDFISEITRHPSIKALLSSRPIPACVDRFKKYPSLRLQDLTRKDIELYLSDHLGAHSLMKRMEYGEPGITASLTSKIINLASGVFLWVVIVVRNLRLRLQDYDTVANLLEEVDRLPSDLEKLYDHMLEGMSEQNRVLGSKLLQVTLRNFELDSSYPMTLLQLLFSQEGDYTKCLKAPIEALEENTCNWLCEATEGRLRSRCCGLIEVNWPEDPSELSVGGKSVGFFHRTVVEFLQTDMVWEKLRLLTSKTTFDAEMALLSSSVSELKVMPIRNDKSVASPLPLARMARMLSYEKHLSYRGKGAFYNTYMPEMRDVLGHHWHDKDSFRSPAEEIQAINSSSNRGCKQMKLGFPYSYILSLSLQFAHIEITPFIRQDLRLDSDFGEQSAAYLTVHCIEEKQTKFRDAISKNIKLLSVDVDKPISFPNLIKRLWNDRWKGAIKGVTRDWSLREFMLHHCFSIMDDSEDGGFDFTNEIMVKSLLRLLEKLLPSNSNPDDGITVAIRPQGKMAKENISISRLSVVLLLFHKIWSMMSKVSNINLDETADLLCTVELKLNGGKRISEKGLMRDEFLFNSKSRSRSSRKTRLMKRISHGSEKPRAAKSTSLAYIPKLLSDDDLPQAEIDSPWFSHTPTHTVRHSLDTGSKLRSRS